MKINVSETQIMKILNEGISLLGYIDNSEVKCYITDKNIPHYFFTYKDDYENKYIKYFGIRDMLLILQNMGLISGCEKSDIEISVRNKNVYYYVKMDYGQNNKRIKKR